MINNQMPKLKKHCDGHASVVGKVNRTEKTARVVKRNRKCPDCGHYYWTEERTLDDLNQLTKDNNEEKLKLVMIIDGYEQLIERMADFDHRQKALVKDIEEAAANM